MCGHTRSQVKPKFWFIFFSKKKKVLGVNVPMKSFGGELRLQEPPPHTLYKHSPTRREELIVYPTIHITNDQALIRLRTTSILLEVGGIIILSESRACRAFPCQGQATHRPAGVTDSKEE